MMYHITRSTNESGPTEVRHNTLHGSYEYLLGILDHYAECLIDELWARECFLIGDGCMAFSRKDGVWVRFDIVEDK